MNMADDCEGLLMDDGDSGCHISNEPGEAMERKWAPRCSSLSGPVSDTAGVPIPCYQFPQSHAVVKSVGPKKYSA